MKNQLPSQTYYSEKRRILPHQFHLYCFSIGTGSKYSHSIYTWCFILVHDARLESAVKQHPNCQKSLPQLANQRALSSRLFHRTYFCFQYTFVKYKYP